MKRKVLLFLMVIALVCMLAISVSAAETTVDDNDFVNGKLYKNTTNEFGTVNHAADTSTMYYYTSTLDTTSRVVLKNGDNTYSTYPTLYIMKSVKDAQGPMWEFDKLNAATGEDYDILSVARIEFPEGTSHVRGGSFAGSTELVYVKIAATVNEIKGNAFQNCSNLAKVEFRLDFEKYPEFGSNVQSVNNGAVFNNCTSLTELILPNSVISVNSSAISGCTNLKIFNPGASFTKTNNQPIGYPKEAFIISDAYQGDYMLFSYDRIKKAATPATLVLYYTGTLSQAQALQEKETQCYEVKYGTLVSYAEFTSSTFVRDESLHYFVYGYNYCEAFYGGNHQMETVNPCVTKCTVCKDTFNVHADQKAEKVTVTYSNGFMSAGVKQTSCSNADCGYAVKEEAPAIFFTDGYSIPEDGRGAIAICFAVNKDALADYEYYNSESLKYGAFAIAYKNITNDEIIDTDSAVIAEVGREYASFEMKITGIETEAQKGAEISFGAYVIDKNGKASYLQAGEPTDGNKFSYVTYNLIANK